MPEREDGGAPPSTQNNDERDWNNPAHVDLAPPTEEALREIEALIHENIRQARDPLLGLEQRHLDGLVALAYTNETGLLALESRVRTALFEAQQHVASSRFSLQRFISLAQRHRTAVRRDQDAARRAAAMPRLVAENGRTVDVPPDGNPLLNSRSLYLIMVGHLEERRHGRIWRDDFYGDNFTDWNGSADDRVLSPRTVDDDFENEAMAYLQGLDPRLARVSVGLVGQAINLVAQRNRRNAPRDWLNGLAWDGVERLPIMLPRAFGTVDDLYHQQVGTKFVMSIALRVRQPGADVHVMPVFYGAQGIGKSRAVKALGGKWYATINVSAAGKDFEDALRGIMVGEVAELDAIASTRVDFNRVKTLLSTSVDRFRPSYGRRTMEFPRTCVLAGTTNDWSWHRDETGGRRFWPVNVTGEIDVGWIIEHRDQLFAEAKARLDRGETIWGIDQAEHERQIAEHLIVDPWIDILRPIIDRWTRPGAGAAYDGFNGAEPFLGPSPASGSVPATVITTEWLATAALAIPTERQTLPTSRRIGKAMRALGFIYKPVRVRDMGALTKCWVRAEPLSEQEAVISREMGRNEDEIPF